MLVQEHDDCLVRLQKSPNLSNVMSAIICLNAILIGVEVQYEALSDTSTQVQQVVFFQVMEVLTTLAFTAELLLHLYAQGTFFFYSREWRWNVFDMLVVVQSLADNLWTYVWEVDK